MKSGGNTFHGSTQGSRETRPGRATTSIQPPCAGFHDHESDQLLLRLERGFRRLHRQEQALVLWRRELAEDFPIPDRVREGPNAQGCWTCPDAEPGEFIRVLDQQYSKVHWQISPSNRLIGTFVRAEKKSPFFGASSTTPLQPRESRVNPRGRGRWESEHPEQQPAHRFGLRILLLLDALLSAARTAVAGNPASQEITTGLLTGPLGAIPGTVSERTRHDRRSVTRPANTR